MSRDGILESKPLRERIADRLRSDIVKGVYEDGERLVEPKLAEMLGISRTPIREALRQLENEGFVEIVPRKGAVVKELTLKDIDDLYAIKANLEGLAARQATEHITDKDIVKLDQINKKFYKISLSKRDIVEEYLKFNFDFHNMFIILSKNEKLIEILEGLDKNFQRLKTILVSKSERAAEAKKEHDKIIKAFATKDPDLAEKTVRWHIENSWEYLRSKLRKRY